MKLGQLVSSHDIKLIGLTFMSFNKRNIGYTVVILMSQIYITMLYYSVRECVYLNCICSYKL